MNPTRKYCRLGDLSTLFGWKHNELISKLEAKRKVKSAAFHARQTALTQLKAKATGSVSKKVAELGLAKLGH